MDAVGKQSAHVADALSQALQGQPELDTQTLNQVAHQTMQQQNQQGLEDFCGLSPDQMSNWMYVSPFG